MSLFTAIFHKIVPNPKLMEQNTYLFIGPHPDDIEIGAGATAAKLVALGKKVVFLIATDGRYGDMKNPVDCHLLAKTRKQEAIDSAKAIGVSDVRFLELADGGMYSIEDATKLITLIVANVKPDIVFIPDPTLETECHLDHLKIGRASYAALTYCLLPQQLLDWGSNDGVAKVVGCAMYYTAKPNTFVGVGKYMQMRLNALLEHKSQFSTNEDINTIKLYLNLRAIRQGARRLRGKSEAFRLIGSTYNHCLTEWAE